MSSHETTVDAQLPEAVLVSIFQLLWIHVRLIRSLDAYHRIVSASKPVCSRAWWRAWKVVSCRGRGEAYGLYRTLYKRFSVNGGKDPLCVLATSGSIGKRMRNVKRWRWLTFVCGRTQYLVKSSIAWPGQEKWFLVLKPTQRLERLRALVRDGIHSVFWLPAGGAPAASICSRCKALCFNEWDALMDALLESLDLAGSDVVAAVFLAGACRPVAPMISGGGVSSV